MADLDKIYKIYRTNLLNQLQFIIDKIENSDENYNLLNSIQGFHRMLKLFFELLDNVTVKIND